MAKLYRVVVRTTASDQPDRSTYWLTDILYCGYDRDEARRVYHESRPRDYWNGYGNGARRTVAQSSTRGD